MNKKYDLTKKLNIIQSHQDMIEFILQTKDHLDCFDGAGEWEVFWGFKLNFDMAISSYTESLEDYLLRGGRIRNMPTKFPCVVLFAHDKMSFSDEDWIYIGGNCK